MNQKRIRNVVITGIATVAGIFGGFKVYSNKKKKFKTITTNNKEVIEETAN